MTDAAKRIDIIIALGVLATCCFFYYYLKRLASRKDDFIRHSPEGNLRYRMPKIACAFESIAFGLAALPVTDLAQSLWRQSNGVPADSRALGLLICFALNIALCVLTLEAAVFVDRLDLQCAQPRRVRQPFRAPSFWRRFSLGVLFMSSTAASTAVLMIYSPYYEDYFDPARWYLNGTP